MKMLVAFLCCAVSVALFNGFKGADSEVKETRCVIATPNHTVPDSIAEVKRDQVLEKQYFKAGLLLKQEGYMADQMVYSYTYANGMKHGKWVEYYQNGQQYSEVNYFFDQRDGSQRFYYSDGSYQFWVEWINGVQLSRLEYPRPNETVMVAPRWKRDGC